MLCSFSRSETVLAPLAARRPEAPGPGAEDPRMRAPPDPGRRRLRQRVIGVSIGLAVMVVIFTVAAITTSKTGKSEASGTHEACREGSQTKRFRQ